MCGLVMETSVCLSILPPLLFRPLHAPKSTYSLAPLIFYFFFILLHSVTLTLFPVSLWKMFCAREGMAGWERLNDPGCSGSRCSQAK
jgi:hypothetical protein